MLQSSFLDIASLILSMSNLDLELTLKNVGEALVPMFADWCTLSLLGPDGRLKKLLIKNTDPAKVSTAHLLYPAYPYVEKPSGEWRAVDSGQSTISYSLDMEALRPSMPPRVYDAVKDFGFRSAMTVPITGKKGVLGVVTVIQAESGRAFGDEDLRLFEKLGLMIGAAIENAMAFRKAEAAVEARSKQEFESLARILDVVPFGVSLIGPDGKSRYMNRAGLALLGRGLNPDAKPAEFARAYEVYIPGTDEIYPYTKGANHRIFELGEHHVREEVEIRHPDGKRVVLESVSTALRDAEGKVESVVTTLHDITEERRRRRQRLHSQLLGTAGLLLSGTLDPDAVLARLPEVVVPQFADWCSVTLRREGQLRSLVIKHQDAGKLALVERIRGEMHVPEPGEAEVIRRVLDSQKPLLVPMFKDSDLVRRVSDPQQLEAVRALGIQSVLMIPIPGENGPIGVVTFTSAESGRHYGPEDARFGEDLGKLAGAAVENARRYQRAREESERQRKDENQRLSSILGSLPLGVALLEPSGKLIYANPGTLAIIGRTIASGIPPDDFMRAYQCYIPGTDLPYPFEKTPFYRVVNKGEERSRADDMEIKHPDGRRVRLEAEIFKLQDGGQGRLLMVAQDITHRHELEEARDRSRLLGAAHAILSSSLDIELILRNISKVLVPEYADWCSISYLQPDGTLRNLAFRHADPDCNRAVRDLYPHYPIVEEPLGEARVVRSQEAILEPQVTPESLNRRATSPEHLEKLRWIGLESVIVVPMLGRQGKPLGAMKMVCTRLSERHYGADDLAAARQLAAMAATAIENAMEYRRAQEEAEERKHGQEEARQRLEERTRAMIDKMLGGLIAVTDTGRIEFLNPAAQNMFGYTAESILGRSIEDLLPNWPLALQREQGRGGRILEDEGRRSDGSEFPLEFSIFEFESGRQTFQAVNVFDLTQRRETERMKKSFVARVSHELRTPLTSVKGSLALLAEGTVGRLDEDSRDLVEMADRNTGRVIALVNDILDLEKLGSGRAELDLANCSVESLLQEAREAVNGLATARRVELRVMPTLERVQADPRRIGQVLMNLFSNAVKFSPEGGSVQVGCRSNRRWVEIAVQDTGPGIPPDEQDLIFEPFYQSEASRSVQPGTGLGLAIAKTIVDQHGGRIGVQSQPGKGSTFWLRLPREVDHPNSKVAP